MVASDPVTVPGRRDAGPSAKLRYRFDNAMSRGPMVVVIYLGILSFVIMLVAALVLTVLHLQFGGGEGSSFGESLWQSMLRTLDAGTVASDSKWPERVIALVVTLAGIFIAGSLIGLIANAVDQKVEELRRGRSQVVETGHTLILGWSAQVPRIVSELVIANESEKRASIVVLANEDKTVMEEVLRRLVPDHKTTRVVCRNGSPASPGNLEIAALAGARSIVVVRDADGDAGVVKAILAVRSLDPTLARTHVVAELSEPDNARVIRDVTGGRVLTVSSDDVVAEVTAQACLQGGLAAVFTDLLDFDGDEIYFTPVPDLAGHTYRQALGAFERSSVIGRMAEDGTVELNPAGDTLIGSGDQLILVAEDDSAIAFTGISDVAVPTPQASDPVPPEPVRIVIVGWSGFGAKVVQQLDEFLPDGSTIDVVIDRDMVDRETVEAIRLDHTRLQVLVGSGGPEDVRNLSGGVHPEQVIVLGYRDALSVDDADARTLLTLLSLRSLWPAGGRDHVRIVAELLDQTNLVLADPVGVDDLIVSNAVSSLLIAQLSERAELQAVFDDLFDVDGAVVEMRPAPTLVREEAMTFGAVVAAGGAVDASVFGYRIGATGRVVVNPAKSDVVTLGPDDQAIVICDRTARPLSPV
jgi:Trk K+ transport system NAD-binding subunit